MVHRSQIHLRSFLPRSSSSYIYIYIYSIVFLDVGVPLLESKLLSLLLS